jgi:hypothetical protein
LREILNIEKRGLLFPKALKSVKPNWAARLVRLNLTHVG